MMYSIGVDLGGTKIAAGITDENHRLLSRVQTPTNAQKGVNGVLKEITDCIDKALLCAELRPAQCVGVGVGCPGVCDTRRGTVDSAHNLGWEGVPLGGLLEDAYGMPCTLENDGNCAALGETLAGAAQGSESALMVTLGTGIGGGFVLDGELYTGFGGLGGEFGHICIAMDGEACTCGERGCWEAYASATALIRQARRAAAACPGSALAKLEAPDGKAVFDAAQAGDEQAGRVVAAYCRYVGVGLVSLINCLYPRTVILGGGISRQGELLLEPVRRYVEAHLFCRREGRMPQIVPALLGADAGLIGAAEISRRRAQSTMCAKLDD